MIKYNVWFAYDKLLQGWILDWITFNLDQGQLRGLLHSELLGPS